MTDRWGFFSCLFVLSNNFPNKKTAALEQLSNFHQNCPRKSVCEEMWSPFSHRMKLHLKNRWRLLKLDLLSRQWVASSCNISLTALCLIGTLAWPHRTSWLHNVSSSPPTSWKQQIGSTKAAAAVWISVWLFYSVQRCILSARKSFINRLTTVNRFVSAKLVFLCWVWTIKGARTIY